MPSIFQSGFSASVFLRLIRWFFEKSLPSPGKNKPSGPESEVAVVLHDRARKQDRDLAYFDGYPQ